MVQAFKLCSLKESLLKFCKAAEKMAKSLPKLASMKAVKDLKKADAKQKQTKAKKATPSKKQMERKKNKKNELLASPCMQAKAEVPIQVRGMSEVTFEMNMATRMQEAKLPQIRGTPLTPHLPVKIGSTKGFVHWKIDKPRLKDWLSSETAKVQKEIDKRNLDDAEKMAMLG